MVNYIAFLIPVFLLLVGIEWYISHKNRDNRYQAGNTIMNMAIGAFDQVGSLLYFVALYFALTFVHENLAPFHQADHWSQWVLAYFAIDFLSYWYHRFSHEINILWAGHITHHSSSLFNFSNGFRTSLFQGVNRIVFWSVLPLFGFSPWVLIVSLKVSGIYDFFLHTTYIPKLGILEKILITPSIHRVHHGKNDIYIDKNYGSTLVIWDKIFGTYQEEKEEVIYGIKAEYKDNNPITAIGFHYRYLWNTMKHTSSFTEKIKLLFMPPDWKPTTYQPKVATPLIHENQSNPSLRQYALYLLITCVSAFVLFMAYHPLMSTTEIVIGSFILLGSMYSASIIYNNNQGHKYNTWEANRIVLCIALVLALFVFYKHVYLLFALFALTTSGIVLQLQLKPIEKTRVIV